MKYEDLVDRVKSVIRPVEGACGICHAAAEEICNLGGKVVAHERPDGILARVMDDQGTVLGEGSGVVWPPAVLSAEIDAGLFPPETAEALTRGGTSTQEDMARVADLHGFGRVLTPAAVALMTITEMGGRTLIRREGLGVIARFFDAAGGVISTSPPSYCPTCAVVIGAARTPFLAEKVKNALRTAENPGRLKYDRGIENRYIVKGGSVRVTLAQNDAVLANRVIGCCMAYGTVKAEIVAGLIPEANAGLFKAYCNVCPYKHCLLEKSMGATGNLVLHRLTEIGTEIEITAQEGIVARIPGPEGQVIQGRGTLCSLSALTNMLLRSDAQKVLKPSPVKRWEERE